jgi:hypothetical protein
MLLAHSLSRGNVEVKLVEVRKACPQLVAHKPAALASHVVGESPTQFTGSCEGCASSPLQEIQVE